MIPRCLPTSRLTGQLSGKTSDLKVEGCEFDTQKTQSPNYSCVQRKRPFLNKLHEA